MKVSTWKNLYIVDRTEKNMGGINLDFDKFLYFGHLETLHSSSFSTVSNFFFNQQMAFTGSKKWYRTGISSPQPAPLFTLFPTASSFMQQLGRVRHTDTFSHTLRVPNNSFPAFFKNIFHPPTLILFQPS